MGYEILALEVPFNAPNIVTLVKKICNADPKPVPQVYSGDLRTLLSRMMAKCPDDRPSSSDIVALPHVRRGIALLLSPSNRRPVGNAVGSTGDQALADTIPAMQLDCPRAMASTSQDLAGNRNENSGEVD